MNKKHGLFLDFTVILLAAIFTFTGCSGADGDGGDGGGGGDKKDIGITLENNNEWGWQKTYEPASLLNGVKITAGDEYIFTYSFKSNVAMDYLQVLFVDNCEATGYTWRELSDYVLIKENITANSLISGSVGLTALATATNATELANRLVFQAGTGTTNAPTLTFTTLTLEKKNNSATTYTVSYNANGGSGTAPASQTVNAGASVTVASQGSLTRSGYTFNGWNTSASGSGTSYSAGSSLTVYADTTLYAQWETTGSGTGTPDQEGVYVGIISFAGDASDLTSGVPILLNSAGRANLRTKLNSDYKISSQSGTALFYGVHKALANLKSNESQFPNNLESVNVITFTDGLDISSDGRSAFSPIENKTFDSADEYATYVNGEIGARSIASKPITAYSVGVRGSDVTDIQGFQNNLAKIASPGKSNELTDFNQVQATFDSIAGGLNIVHTNTSFTLVTALLSSNTKVRMTFDVTGSDHSSAAGSAKYIEGVINRTGTTYTFTNIVYSGGLGSTQGSGPITGTVNGSEVSFEFAGVSGYNSQTDQSKTKQWLWSATTSQWQINSEYSSVGSSTSTVERRSSVIYLVLDASTSLSTIQIGQIRDAAIAFIDSLYSQSSGTGN
jgi:uncharacterized repeat protein (TIGR02543 family)